MALWEKAFGFCFIHLPGPTNRTQSYSSGPYKQTICLPVSLCFLLLLIYTDQRSSKFTPFLYLTIYCARIYSYFVSTVHNFSGLIFNLVKSTCLLSSPFLPLQERMNHFIFHYYSFSFLSLIYDY